LLHWAEDIFYLSRYIGYRHHMNGWYDMVDNLYEVLILTFNCDKKYCRTLWGQIEYRDINDSSSCLTSMMVLHPYWSCLRQTLTRSATPLFLANTRWNHISSLGYSAILCAVKQNSCLFIRTRVSLYGSSFSSSTIRLFRTGKAEKEHTRSVLTYIVASAVFMIGATYAGVPLYRMLCQVNKELWLIVFLVVNCLLYFNSVKNLMGSTEQN